MGGCDFSYLVIIGHSIFHSQSLCSFPGNLISYLVTWMVVLIGYFEMLFIPVELIELTVYEINSR